MKTSLLHVTTVHRPFDSRIYQKEARALAAAGWDVTLATTIEKAQSAEGVKLVPLGRSGGSRLARLPRNLRALRRMIGSRGIVHIHDPELLITAAVPLLVGRRVIFDVHEPAYHETLDQAHYIPSPLRPAVRSIYRMIERLLMPRLAGVVVTAESMIPHYAQFIGNDRVALVRNFPNISTQERVAAVSAGSPLRGPYILHTGGASKIRAFHLMVAVAERLRALGNRTPIVNLGLIDLNAYEQTRREDLVRRAEAADVRLLGVVPYGESLRWTAHARLGYMPMEYDVNNAEGIPNKLFEYFAFGKPVVACAFGRVAEFIAGENAGVLAEIDDVESHARILQRLLDDDQYYRGYAEAAAEAGKAYSFATEAARLEALYQTILSDGS